MTNAAAVELGRLGGLKGGKSRSKAKQAAARKNGKLGGRPKLNHRPASRATKTRSESETK